MTQDPTWLDAEAYDRYVGRWSRLVGTEFLDWLNPVAGMRWLDVGTGSGNLPRLILERATPGAVRGVDLSPEHVDFARKQVADERASFAVSDAAGLANEPDESYDAVVSGLVLNFVPEPVSAVREMARVVRPGGIVAAYVWDYAGGMQMMRYFWDAAVDLDPGAVGLDEGRRFSICNPEGLRGLWSAAGLREIETWAIDVPTVFAGFDDYWQPFLGGQGPAPGYAVSLDEVARLELRDLLRSRLPTADDGSISLTARAWAIRGIR